MHHTSTPDQPLYRVFVPPEAAHQLNGDLSTAPAPVVIILDISPGNWKLVALPGALQRIVMNLVGNSLKYTSSGFVRVKLDIHPSKEDLDSHKRSAVVELNVIDSGRGISNEFLKTKLFCPFSQETILAPGTGTFVSNPPYLDSTDSKFRSWSSPSQKFGSNARREHQYRE